MSRRDALVLRAFAGWTVYVWVTRLWNIVRDDDPAHGIAFKSVHAVLAVVSVAFAVATWKIVSRNRSRASDRVGIGS